MTVEICEVILALFFHSQLSPTPGVGSEAFHWVIVPASSLVLRTYPVDFPGKLRHADDFRLQAIDCPGSHVTGRVTTVTTAIFCSHTNLFYQNLIQKYLIFL